MLDAGDGNHTTSNFPIDLPLQDLFFPETSSTGINCVSKIAASGEGNDTRIFLGDPFFRRNYVVYDMTPYDERNLDYIQIGIAPKNPQNLIGLKEYASSTEC